MRASRGYSPADHRETTIFSSRRTVLQCAANRRSKAFWRDCIGGVWPVSRFIAGFLAIVAWTIPNSPTRADATVGLINEFCHSADDMTKAVCRFYIMGAVSGVKLSQAISGSRKVFCVPDDISEDDIVPRFIATADIDLLTFPQDKDESAAAMILSIIAKTFPCR